MITKLLTAPKNPYSVRSSGAIWSVGATFIAVVHVCVVEFTCTVHCLDWCVYTAWPTDMEPYSLSYNLIV